MRNDTYRLYKYGEKYKLVYYKFGNEKPRDKPRFEALAEWYEDNSTAGHLPPELAHDYDIGYLNSLALKKGRKALEAMDDFEALETDPKKLRERFLQSVSRSKSKVYELALCNDFKWFVTLTVDPKKLDRFELSEYRKKLSMFIRNFNRCRSKVDTVKYLLVPEQHKDGAWHMHGLFLGLREDDLCVNANGYLDWEAYRKRFGFISLSAVKDHNAVSAYITKYISKNISDSPLEANKHLYFASQGLNRRVSLPTDETADLKALEWEYENDYVKLLWLDEKSAQSFIKK